MQMNHGYADLDCPVDILDYFVHRNRDVRRHLFGRNHSGGREIDDDLHQDLLDG